MISLTHSLIKAKVKAGLIHFTISLFIFCLMVAWAYFFAYPDIYFTMAGAVQGLALVFFVDAVLGPLLTFLVYNPAKPKKEIISDFVIIGAVQFGALIYGVYTLYQEKPSAVVIYPKSNASVIGYRELADFELGDLSAYGKLGKLPVAIYNPSNKTRPYSILSTMPNAILDTDIITRKAISANADDAHALQDIESKYGKVYIIGLMAKYNGAYIALDENYAFVAKFGEKPIS